ncbi:ABC transporter permease [Shewanella surugensis]|uniref:FtsX-like permease family protein n=1 Tax=Shewanella surugensis TaxID=212020 RepID=A0ABT0L6G0_9GAMM|nr:FtsX-like permease family protein [Shewanella surugensis]MCL1123268.1 FtsX-like permease family protein [Shewanella surugensis]
MLHVKPILSSLMRNKTGPLLLLVQIMLSVAIVANASFIIIERLSLMQRDSGVEETQVFTFNLYAFDTDTDIDLDKQRQRDLAAIRRLPEVIDASTINMSPLGGGGSSSTFTVGESQETSQYAPEAPIFYSDEHLVNTLGVKLIEGRNFYADEVITSGGEAPTLVLVTQVFAQKTWGDESPLGQIIYMGEWGDYPVKVIGVIETLQGAWVDREMNDNSLIFNVPMNGAFHKYVVRSDLDNIASLKEIIPALLHQDEPNRVIKGFKTIAEYRQSAYRAHELMATVLGMMVILLLLITSLGLAGLVMFNVGRRTKQIGTRRALGATKGDIVRFFLVENYIICIIGGSLGAILALQLGEQLMQLYSLPILAPIYPLLTFLGLIVLTTIAVIVPAQKAAMISPATATRSV